MPIIQSIQNRIYEIRNEKIMLDKDLAMLYETETKTLNLAVKRNLKRFPSDFMFQLTKEEWNNIKSENENFDNGVKPLRLQIETSKRGGTRYLPYAFTEQGVAMLSGILNSDKAIIMNIAIMRAFVDVRRILSKQNDMEAVAILEPRRNKVTSFSPIPSALITQLQKIAGFVRQNK